MEKIEEKVPAIFKFKTVKKRSLRQRQTQESDEEDETTKNKANEKEDFNREKLLETKELQKLRQRSNGVSHVTLAIGKKLSKVEEIVAADEDPFKIRTGGLLTLSKAKAAKAAENPELSKNSEDSEEVVGTQFSKETRVRDEDEEMRKFIETEMEKRQGRGDDQSAKDAFKYLSPGDRALLSLPEHLRKSTFKKNEEMLSSQMLSGIPEVDLGIDEKIRNIEATEEAKKKLAEMDRKKSKPSEFVPTNLAVNFKHQNRFKVDIDQDEHQQVQSSKRFKKEPETIVTQRTVVVGDLPEEKVIRIEGMNKVPSDPDKATDDLHVSKFKQHFQRK